MTDNLESEDQIFVFGNESNIYNYSSKLAIDVYGGYRSRGTNLILWKNHGGINQK